MKIKVHLFRVWPDVMGTRPGESLLEWGRMRVRQQQDEITSEEVIRWKIMHERIREEDDYESILINL